MPQYRVYVLDEHGHPTGTVKLDCADDQEAKERINQLGGQRVELWRQVPLLEPDSPRGPEWQ